MFPERPRQIRSGQNVARPDNDGLHRVHIGKSVKNSSSRSQKLVLYGPDNFRFSRNHFKNSFLNLFGKDMEIGNNTTDAQPLHIKENMRG
jgi:hypothetical protein